MDDRDGSYLAHWEWASHKYIAKVKRSNGKYRYFYDEEEYQNYLKGKEMLGDNFDDLLDPDITDAEPVDIFDLIGEFATTTMDHLSDVFDGEGDFFQEAGEFITDLFMHPLYKEKVKMPNGEYRYFYGDEYERYMERQKYLEDEPEFMKDIPKIKITDTFSDDYDQKVVNYEEYQKDYEQNDEDHSINCINCTVGYELRQRGYDVEAEGYTPGNKRDIKYIEDHPIEVVTPTWFDRITDFFVPKKKE